MSLINIENFTWDNLHADIYLGLHAYAMRRYLESVITPALDSIDSRHDELSRSEEVSAAFELVDVASLRGSTIEAFALSIQSQWERQLRDFLKGSARELKRSETYVASLATDPWLTLLERFQDLRGLPLQTFDSFPDLELLQLLGNACRHGDGKSARLLYERCPELWSHRPLEFPISVPEPALADKPNHPSFSEVNLPRSLLVRLTQAVIWFWEDHNYIYTNSIKSKHWSVDGTLAKMRDERAQRQR